jgi:tetratricopeptide (TPR) repeat protein
MNDVCRNEEWLAAYLDKRLSEEDLRLYEMHLSLCPKCLAEVIATKAELDHVTAEEARPALATPRLGSRHGIGPWAWMRGPARLRPAFESFPRILRPVPLAAALSIAAIFVIAAAFMFSMYFRSADREFRKEQPLVARILAVRSIGEMRLSDGPEQPFSNPTVYRGVEASGTGSTAVLERNLTRALERHGTSARLNALLGDLYIADNQIERADNSYARALELDPGNAAFLNDRAVTAYRLGRFGESRGFLEDARAAGGERLEVLYNLAVLAGETGDHDSKLHYADLYLKRDSSSPWAERMKALAHE